MNGFGNRLKEARLINGYNQKQFAELLGITPTRLNYWEKDKREPDFFMFSKIVKLLNADANKLLNIRPEQFCTSTDEKKLITGYRSHPEMQAAVNKILDLDKTQKQQCPFTSISPAHIAAYNQEITEPDHS